jgi:hypothetical protein
VGTELVSVLNVSWAYQQVGRVEERSSFSGGVEEEKGRKDANDAKFFKVEGSRYPASHVTALLAPLF